ncbi:D-glycero-alpha-D-manno-heptose-1,7-bisphosphate 7-phosphatase [Pseudoxanthomonas mexicana]
MMAIAPLAPYTDPAAPSLLRTLPAPRKALFLDRDGVINVNHGYVHTPEQTDWVAGIFELVEHAHAAGFVPVVVTNQAGIARGYYDEAQFERYTCWMHECFAQRGTPLLATYHCPHHPEAGLGEWKVACGCRKPEPGMLLQASRDWKLDLSLSVLVGDQRSDIEAAGRAGVRTAFLLGDVGFGDVMRWLDARSGGCRPSVSE